MIELYAKYLENITATIDEFFKQQKAYICCKKGCSNCCEEGEYPFSELEFEYAMLGVSRLAEDKKEKVFENIKTLREEKEKHSEGKFIHRCPFLVEKTCSIYEYRGLICRTHGLMYFTQTDSASKGRVHSIPDCVSKGLNYSKVFDNEAGQISSEMWKESGILEEPCSYNLGLNFLTDNETTKALGLNFGKTKALCEWIL